ncbi:MAG TPA: CRTAC1 family protein [Acidobacteriaceae bacterium]|nr:CRTAC1 family protein [Acidobacteriaceae bacterium]
MKLPYLKLTTTTLLAAALIVSGCKKSKEAAPASSESHTPNASASETTSTAQPTPPKRPSGAIQFTDITSQAGIRFVHDSGAFGKKYLPETMGSGVCFIDYDNDGWQDIFFVNSMDWPGHKKHTSYPALYHNNHDGTFTDVTRQASLDIEMYGMGCAVGDYDNDGRDDLYVTAVGKSHLFRNLGNGTFQDVTAKAGVSSPGFATSAAWVDYDRDGKLDLLVDHYVHWTPATDQTCSLDGKHKSYCTPELYKGESVRLYHNEGGGRFKDVTKAAGLYDASDKALGIAVIDYDNDGWPDLFITNDTQPNKLYHNNHNGTFTEVGFASGVAFSDAGKARAGMGTDVANYDGSGRQSLVIGNFTNESLALYHNDGQGLFSDHAIAAGLAAPSAKSLTFSTFFFDYNLDGLPDIFALNGHVADDISVIQPSLSYAEPPLLFRNTGGGKFADVSRQVGSALRKSVVGRGAAYGDIDNDGDLDLVLTASSGPARLLRNDNGNQNDMLRVRTVGTRSNRDGIGAKLVLTSSTGEHISRMVKSGSSYLSQSELPLTFGLGKPDPARRLKLEILWPSGHKEIITDIHPDQFITVEEGKGIIAAQPISFK